MAEQNGDDITITSDHQGFGTPVFTNPVANLGSGLGESHENYTAYPQEGDYRNERDIDGLVPRNGPFNLSLNVSVDKTGAIALIFAACLIVLISAARICSDLDRCPYDDVSVNYAVAVGVVSMVVSGLYIFSLKYKPAMSSRYSHFVSIFLLIWWGVGAGILTFNKPFLTVGNGYFASWLGFAMSGNFASQTLEYFSTRAGSIQSLQQDRKIMFFIFMASIIEIAAASLLCGDSRKDCSNDYAFAVACGVLSACICLIYLVAGGNMPINWVAGFLMIWWMLSTGILTVDEGDPFGFVGNGYFAVWCCFLGSFYLCYHVFVATNSASAY